MELKKRMSFRNFIGTYFNNHAETSEHHYNASLQSRYFKTNKTNALAALEEMLHKSGEFSIHAISEEHGEISAHKRKGKKAFMVITVVMVRPYRTAIDFSVTTESILPFDFGYSSKLIQRLYNQLEQELPLVDKH
ncbi:cytosolic protein [Virgibacillus halophilus]|uniref:Cytosolic protein n=1 Tax=Tigheibacillus halophilus TaxID=361280 RepID=A0ABU5CEK8_9BACI|nr:cytosolic protein [Virgibacillus halophilus]